MNRSDKNYYVYILTNHRNTVLYIGMTNDLQRRMCEHKMKMIEGFTAKYNLNKLVYFDMTTDVTEAIAREKQMKGWLRKKKVVLIESINSSWKDLSEEWISLDPSPSAQDDNKLDVSS